MDEIPDAMPTRPLRVAAWIVAAVVGALVGVGIAALTQDVGIGVVVGIGALFLVGFSIVLAVRRGGHGTVEGAPPWTGDAGARGIGGGSS